MRIENGNIVEAGGRAFAISLAVLAARFCGHRVTEANRASSSMPVPAPLADAPAACRSPRPSVDARVSAAKMLGGTSALENVTKALSGCELKLADIDTVVTVDSKRLDGLLVPVEILGNPGRFYCNITPRDEADRLFDTLSDRNGMFPM